MIAIFRAQATLVFILIATALFSSGCMTAIGRGSELGPEYYSDFEYSPIDGRWYHKTPPDTHGMRETGDSDRRLID